MPDTTVDSGTLDILLATAQRIDARLARLEELLLPYEPLLAEAARKMAGPMLWSRKRGGQI